MPKYLKINMFARIVIVVCGQWRSFRVVANIKQASDLYMMKWKEYWTRS